jgi:hypothetical protein
MQSTTARRRHYFVWLLPVVAICFKSWIAGFTSAAMKFDRFDLCSCPLGLSVLSQRLEVTVVTVIDPIKQFSRLCSLAFYSSAIFSIVIML